MLHRNSWIAFFWLTLLITFVIYQPGLQGGFLFDDMPNLSPMGDLGEIRDWETFRAFVFNGIAGPLGRPIALASFLLDDNYWPSQPGPFKLTNLWLHLLTGVLLCWTTLSLLRLYGVSEREALLGSILNMAFWLLHPYMVSTTLYVVQRMAQLATLFIIIGLGCYLHGRLLLQHRKSAAYLWMSTSLVFCTAFAALSKENGILLPPLVLVIEFFAPKPDQSKSVFIEAPDWRWRVFFLWLPSLAIIWALSKEINFSPNIWPNRPFNQIERLLTEPRILLEYIFHLYVPRIEGRGLFQDGYPISTGPFSPASTAYSILGVSALIIAGISLRRKMPLLGLAILFFFVSHLVESTVVGLELYFEHRNYSAALFVFLPVIGGLLWIKREKSNFIAISAAFSIIIMLSALTWQRSKLWSNTDFLQSYWATSTPESPRAQNYLATRLFQNGKTREGFELLETASDRLPQSSLLSMQWLLQKITRDLAKEEDFSRIKQNLPKQRFDAQSVMGMRLIVENLIEFNQRPDYCRHALGILNVMRELPQYNKVPSFNRLEPYLRGLLLTTLGHYDEAATNFTKAIRLHKNVEAGLSMVAHMGNSGRPKEALQLLDEAQKVYLTQSSRRIKRSKESYNAEIEWMRTSLQKDLTRQAITDERARQ